MTTKTKTRAVAYVRVSTDKQAGEGVSLEAQEAKLRAFAVVHDLDLVEVVVDAGISAKRGSVEARPGLQRVLGMIKRREVDALVVIKLDRLTRSVVDLGLLVEEYFSGKSRAALMSLSENIDTRTAAGMLVLNVLGSVADWERQAIGERTKSALQHKKSTGERVGAIPYGFALADDGVHLVEAKGEQAVIAEARTLRASGLSLGHIAKELAARGFQTRAGRGFASEQVRRMVNAA